MAKHKHNRPHGEPDEPDNGGAEAFDGLAAFDAATPAPDDPVPSFTDDAPRAASPNPAAGAVPPVPLKAVPMKKATVTMPGCPPVEVEYPADTPEANRHAAAKAAYMYAVGQWALPAEPHIDLHD